MRSTASEEKVKGFLDFQMAAVAETKSDRITHLCLRNILNDAQQLAVSEVRKAGKIRRIDSGGTRGEYKMR